MRGLPTNLKTEHHSEPQVVSFHAVSNIVDHVVYVSGLGYRSEPWNSKLHDVQIREDSPPKQKPRRARVAKSRQLPYIFNRERRGAWLRCGGRRLYVDAASGPFRPLSFVT